MREWMINIVVYMLFCSFLHNISPGAKYKKYMTFLMGVIMLVIILSPVGAFLSFTGENAFSEYVTDLELYLEAAEKPENGYADYVDMSLERAGLEYLMEQGITSGRISVTKGKDGTIRKIVLYIDEQEQTEDSAIKKIISQFYNLEQERIYIVRQVVQ